MIFCTLMPAMMGGFGNWMVPLIAHYPDAFGSWNYISSVGAYISVAGVVTVLIGVAHAFIRKRRAGRNPWDPGCSTLEWTLSTPPRFHAFDKLPQVR